MNLKEEFEFHCERPEWCPDKSCTCIARLKKEDVCVGRLAMSDPHGPCLNTHQYCFLSMEGILRAAKINGYDADVFKTSMEIVSEESFRLGLPYGRITEEEQSQWEKDNPVFMERRKISIENGMKAATPVSQRTGLIKPPS